MSEHTHSESPYGDPLNIFAAMMAQGDPPDPEGEKPDSSGGDTGDPPNTGGGGGAPTPTDPGDTGDPPNTGGGGAPTSSQPGDPPNTGG